MQAIETQSTSKRASQGRKIPSHISSQAFRTFLKRATLIISAGVSVTNCTPEHATPIDPDVYSEQSHKRVDAERAHMEQAFTHEALDIIDFEFMDQTRVNPAAYQRRTNGNGLQPYYKLESRDNIYQTVLAGYSQMGTFNLDVEQKAHSDAYVPEDVTYPDEVTTLTQRAAYNIASGTADNLTSGSLGMARLVQLDRHNHDTEGKACTVVLMSENFDSDMFVAEFSRIDSVMSRKVHDVADFNQAIANHEFGHCFKVSGDAQWKNESQSDLYAMARHIQLNGNDGFAEVWRDLRNMNVIGARSSGHDTVPLLDRAIPALLQAHAAGELKGLDPQELMNFTLTKTARSRGQTQKQMWDSLELEVHDREEAFKDMQGVVSRIGPTMHLDREGLAKKDLSTTEVRGVQRVITSFNQSLEQQFVLQCPVARKDKNGQENAVFARYRENLEAHIPTQPTAQQAYESLGHRLWQIDDAHVRNAQRFNEQTASFLEATDRDATGLTNAEKRAILEEMRTELGQRPDVTPDPEAPQREGVGPSV